jgi:2-polyprenyl-6-methoxyphenol hydroxylase-like FAD-dependent oxidoreductase
MTSENKIAQTQVVIIGAGPTGLSLAAQLLRYGIDFVILEKNAQTTILSKAVAVQARTLEIFDEIGLATKAVEQGRITTAMNMYYKGRQRAFINLNGLGEGLSPFPFALSLEQSKTEKLLVEHLLANGKNIQWSSAFDRFTEHENGITVFYSDINGHSQQLEAKYIVGCDGAGSQVRHQMGLPFEGDTVPKIFYVADVTLTSTVINKNELFIFLIKKGFVLFFPMEGEVHYRVIGIVPNAKEPDQDYNFENIEQFVKEGVKVPLDFKNVRWFSTYKVHSRKAAAFSKGRSFIAGDAAHIHTPAGGQGMNTGIQDAYNLAWKLAFVLNKKASNKLLQTYTKERENNARNLLRTTDRMFDLMSGATPFSNFIRVGLFPFFAGLISRSAGIKKRIFPLISQTGISYNDSPLTVKTNLAKASAGARMPYFIFSNGKSIFDFIRAPSFKVLIFGKIDEAALRISDFVIKPIVLHFDETPSAIFGNETDFFVLLRPDNHIAYIGKEIQNYLQLMNSISLRVV